MAQVEDSVVDSVNQARLCFSTDISKNQLSRVVVQE